MDRQINSLFIMLSENYFIYLGLEKDSDEVGETNLPQEGYECFVPLME